MASDVTGSYTVTTNENTHLKRAKVDALRNAVWVADLLVGTVDGRVQELYINEKLIELEAHALLATIARYMKQTDQWLAATNEIKCYEYKLYMKRYEYKLNFI
ncbi:hypothetical protein E2562_020611 [Oryza meyeriana var. granulata]|uniref:Biogenesis of lysosome-related organelles complex 1 subunit 1 n=1 Tax=Oryza meyeriana var. granulata TaxID=110450 RepID=A0A6G1DYB5_9ORYZ|nr:hypothetical protein E2562_020611 [Oryza meyeriana var. granulata]